GPLRRVGEPGAQRVDGSAGLGGPGGVGPDRHVDPREHRRVLEVKVTPGGVLPEPQQGVVAGHQHCDTGRIGDDGNAGVVPGPDDAEADGLGHDVRLLVGKVRRLAPWKSDTTPVHQSIARPVARYLLPCLPRKTPSMSERRWRRDSGDMSAYCW